MEKETYKLIDRFLIQLEKSPNGIRIPFNRSLPVGKAAIQLMMKYELADFGTNDIPSINFVQKNLNGVKVLEAEGFENWINKKILKEDAKEILELRRLELDIKNAERIYKTYWITFGMALVGLVLSILLGLMQLLKKDFPKSENQQLSVKHANAIR